MLYSKDHVVGFLNRDTGHQGNTAGSNVLLNQHRLSGLKSKAEPGEPRGLTLYMLASRLQKQKAKLNPYMLACNSIGYFNAPPRPRPSAM
jgi:hypothetical protein